MPPSKDTEVRCSAQHQAAEKALLMGPKRRAAYDGSDANKRPTAGAMQTLRRVSNKWKRWDISHPFSDRYLVTLSKKINISTSDPGAALLPPHMPASKFPL